MERGNLAGVPVVDVKTTLVDGSYHTVDSSELSFKLAARLAWRHAQDTAGSYLLEPIMQVSVNVPDRYMGDVISDLNSKRGHVVGMESVGGRQSIKAEAPQAEMFHFAADLRSITQGRGSFSMHFDHYAEVPANIAQPIIDAYARERSGKEEE
jgi:elongation factor G